MATLTVQNSLITGLQPTYVSVASTDVFANDGRTVIYVKNAGGSPDVVTIDSLQACNQGVDHNGGGTVTNATEKVFGPFDVTRFNDANGQVSVAHGFLTSVTCAVLRLP